MPVQQKDIENKKKPARPVFDRQGRRHASDGPDGETTRYGMGHDAELNPRGEETQEQEYMADGLPRTDKYSVDKTGSRGGMGRKL